MMTMESYTSDFGLRMSIEDQDQNYLRMQMVSVLEMDNIESDNIKGLFKDGETLYERDQEQLKAILRLIIDDTYS